MIDDQKEQFILDISDKTPKIVPRSEKPKKPIQSGLTMLVYSGQIGTAIIVPLLIGIGAGRYIDGIRNSHPTWVLIGLGGGFFFSLFSLFATVKDIITRLNNINK